MEAGQVLNDRYLLAERLGEGGMSVVWRAHDRVLGREVAVKVLNSRLAADADWRRRIRLEAQAAARLSHPNVTNVYDYGETADDAPFVVMELLRGPTLAELLARGPLEPAAAVRIGAEVAAGLAAAHAEDLVHRDVKPANVMLTPEAAKVLDFGLVGFVGLPDPTDGGRLVFGTPAYLAPERLISDDVTPASDVYAFGLLLYRCLTGRLPWDSETTTQMVEAHVTIEPAPLPEIPGVPAAVRELCMSCLAKDPADRPAAVVVAARLATAAGIVPRFSVVLQDRPAGADAPPAADPTTELVALAAAEEPAPDRRRVLFGVAVLVAIAAVLVTAALSRPFAGPAASAEEMKAQAPVTVITSSGPAAEPSGDPSANPSAEVSSDPAQPSSTPATVATVAAEAGKAPEPNKAGSQGVGGGNPGPGGQGGGGTVAAPPPANREPTTGPQTNVSTAGGVVVAACVGDKVNVIAALPAAGAVLTKADLGLHRTAKVEFLKGAQRLRYDVSCQGGAPVAVAA